MFQIRERLKQLNAENILDVGTGHCEFIFTLNNLLDNPKYYTGVDISGKNLEEAKDIVLQSSLKNRIKLINGDFLAGCFDDNEFDIVSIANGFLPASQRGLFLDEAKRVLKDDGKVIVDQYISPVNEAETNYIELKKALEGKFDQLNITVDNQRSLITDVKNYFDRELHYELYRKDNLSVDNVLKEEKVILSKLKTIYSRKDLGRVVKSVTSIIDRIKKQGIKNPERILVMAS